MESANVATPFCDLTPDVVMDSVEALGFECDGRLLALNSYENRVWQVGIENDQPIIAKFYRPNRWSNAAIEEEHAFAWELTQHELPVIAPLVIQGRTLHQPHNHRLALYTRHGGHAPEFTDKGTLESLGRLMGRIHAVSSTGAFSHRPRLSPELWGQNSIDFLLATDWIPAHLYQAFESITRDLMTEIRQIWTNTSDANAIRLHGDCHAGNILCRDAHVHFVDLDDCCMGPAIQDLWMWLSGDHRERSLQLSTLVHAYEDFCPFNRGEIRLIEALRTLRMIHYQAWLARRWDDPAFQKSFSWFGEDRHWERFMEQLREQLHEIHQPPLVLEPK
jgi:Ser/Thr protein kinase RdoA (MazF antagonist)